MATITACVKFASTLACILCVGVPEIDGSNHPSAQSGCHIPLALAAAVDPEPRLSAPAKPFVLDFAGLVFMRDGTVQRVQEIEPFELHWHNPASAGLAESRIDSSRLAQMRLLDMRQSIVELTTKSDSVSIVPAVTQGDENKGRALGDRLAGITCRVKRFNAAREAYEQFWQYTPWRDIDTVMFVGTPGVKRCPVDDRRFPGFYRFSPYTGTELVWEGQASTLPPSVACSNCRKPIARSGALCGACASIQSAGRGHPVTVRAGQSRSARNASRHAGSYSGTK